MQCAPFLSLRRLLSCLFVYSHVVNALDKLHAKHALPGFTDRTAEEREIEAVTAEITTVNPTLSFFRSSFPRSADIAYHWIEFPPLSSPYSANWFGFHSLLPSFASSGLGYK